MLTPQEIQEVKFVRSVKGYDKEQVEDFLDTVYSDYAALYKENATLKGKMRVLVDKIDEYRSVDEQMRKTFYAAQQTAQETIDKARAEADLILRNARSQAEDRVNDIREQIEAEEKRLTRARAEAERYADGLRALLNRYIGDLDTLMAMSGVEIMSVDDEDTGAFEPRTPVHVDSDWDEEDRRVAQAISDTINIELMPEKPPREPAELTHEEQATVDLSKFFGKKAKEEEQQ